MKWIAALVLICLGATTLAAPSYRYLKIKYDMWLVACEYSQWSCEGVPLPNVVYERMSNNIYGHYNGGEDVFINKKLYGSQRRATILHEMSHYLDVVVGTTIVPGPAEQICKSEATAFALVDRWWVSIGKPSKVRGPNWWRVYPHCRRFYSPNYGRYGWW